MNGARGEVGLSIGGVERRLCLTLGALAEIETAFGCASMGELQVRLKQLSAGELMQVVAALMRGAGEVVEDLREVDLSPGAAAKAVAEAFRAALG